MTRSVCVAAGASPEEVARALGLDAPPAGGPLHVEPGPRGALAWSEAGSASIFLWDLAEALPGLIYLLVAGPDPGRFFCRVAQGETEVGTFEAPWPENARTTRLDDVEGETEPARIAAALGVPPELLRLKGPA